MTSIGVGAQSFLLVVADRDVKKNAGEKDDDEHAGGGAGEKFEVEMPLAEKPGERAAGNTA